MQLATKGKNRMPNGKNPSFIAKELLRFEHKGGINVFILDLAHARKRGLIQKTLIKAVEELFYFFVRNAKEGQLKIDVSENTAVVTVDMKLVLGQFTAAEVNDWIIAVQTLPLSLDSFETRH